MTREYIIVANGTVLSSHDYEREARQKANERVLDTFQEVLIYKKLGKHWRVAADDSPRVVEK